METNLLAALRRALETMLSRIEAGEDILEALQQIDALHKTLPPSTPKMLLHYLERKSYTKALAYLETLT